jgi:glycerophosphoryl diester phosphodiesterase
VSGKSLAELKEIALRRKGNLHPEEKIPTLKGLAAILSGPVSLALELKDRQFADSAVCLKLVRELRGLGLLDRTMVLASSRRKVLAMREADSRVPIGFISFALAPTDSVELLGPYWPLLFVNPLYVRWAHRRGIIVCPLDPRPDGRLALYRARGCDALLTDNPGATIAALRKIEARA